MSNQELPQLSEGQLEIVNVIWDLSEASVGQVWKVLRQRRPVARNTVSTLITRLAEKGWLRQRLKDGTYCYTVAQPRKKALARLAGQLIDAAFAGSAEGLVLTLLEDGRLKPDEVERIKAMLQTAEVPRRRKEK
jgi:BlaI family transcriptional regulator, penicillinase repressor